MDDYLGKVQTANVLQGIFNKNTKTIEIEQNVSKKLFDSEKMNNIILLTKWKAQIEYQQPSIPTAISSLLDQVSPTPSSQPQEQEHKRFNCFYCDQAYSSDKECVEHIECEHPSQGALTDFVNNQDSK